MAIRILLVDDHRVFQEGLRAILERDARLEVVGAVSDGRLAVEAARKLEPEIVIMDIGMRGLNGVDATRQLLSENPSIKVIALSAHNDRRFVLAMLDAGASGYVLKEATSEEILGAIRVVHRGQKFLSPGVTDVGRGSLGRPSTAKTRRSSSLAPRQREVLQLLAEGCISKEIARRLDISVLTVETHRRNIMRRLKMRNMAALVKFAIREGLTSVEDS